MASRGSLNLGALPCSLRPVVMASISSRLLLIPARLASTSASNSSISSSSATRSSNPSALRAVSFVPGPSNIPGAPLAILAKPPRTKDVRKANEVFLPDDTRLAAEFLYSVPHFRDLPMNTTVPEVCILGRSNVGKSTLINALAGMDGSKAGRVAKTQAKKGVGLAVTSSTAGSTRTMNGYGFGPPPPPSAHKQEDETPKRDDVVGGRSRGQVRKDAKAKSRAAEKHRHSLILVDMPGYGLSSQESWGDEIQKYFARRKMLRGAVLLIDASVGIKVGDRTLLKLLCSSGVRTAVVLTKGDKLVPPSAASSFASSLADEAFRNNRDNRPGEFPGAASDPASDGSAGSARDGVKETTVANEKDKGKKDKDKEPRQALETACKWIWNHLDSVSRKNTYWRWENDIFVTGAGDPRAGGFGVAGARLAICRLAGLVKTPPAVKELNGQKKDAGGEAASQSLLSSPETVPFNDITWSLESSSSGTSTVASGREQTPSEVFFDDYFGESAHAAGRSEGVTDRRQKRRQLREQLRENRRRAQF